MRWAHWLPPPPRPSQSISTFQEKHKVVKVNNYKNGVGTWVFLLNQTILVRSFQEKIMTKVVKKVCLIGKSLHYLSRICKYIISSVVISAENMLVPQAELIFLWKQNKNYWSFESIPMPYNDFVNDWEQLIIWSLKDLRLPPRGGLLALISD